MKKRLFLASCAVTLMAGATVLSSCSSAGEEYSYSPEKAHELIEKDYKAAFIQKYGQISPFETWDLSRRGSQLAGFAGTRGNGHGQDGSIVQDMASTESYGYVLDYDDKENQIANLFHNKWDDIVDAFSKVQPTTWNPGTKKIGFSVLAVSKNSASNTKYFTWGIAGTDEGDLFLRQGSAANGKDLKIGNSAEKHTSSLDFSMIPSGARWFTSATSKKQVDLSSDYNQTITDYKVIKITLNNKEYTFWGFKCDATNPEYTNLVIWVEELPTVPVPVIAKRYLVEDLGGSYDFDFNDVVFDVIKFTDGSQKCYVRALGGTLDVTIKVGNNSWTKRSKYTITDMLNTNPIDPNLILHEFDVTGWDGDDSKVSVIVEGNEEAQGGTTTYYWAVPFPAQGEVPLIVATMYGSKTWMPERQSVPNVEWFQFSDIDLSND
jgi:hypothetical protein